MFEREEKRRFPRLYFRSFIQYEKVLPDGSLSVAMTVPAQDISKGGIGCYCADKMELDSRVRVTFYVLDNYKVSFVGKVVRMEVIEEGPFDYLIGLDMVTIDQESQARIHDFIDRINIYNLLDSLSLEDIVDIHFISNYPPILKKIGRYEVAPSEVLSEGVTKALLLNTLDNDRYKQFMREKECNFVFLYKEGFRFRVNLHIQQGKVEGVFRLIPYEVQLPDQLGLPKIVPQLAEHKRGLILIAGRTGSGKSTTLASLVEHINHQRTAVIMSIEHPIEYIHTNKKSYIKQREVGRDTLSFSSAAKNALRQNPDVLVIGEILDRETMEVAITAAETGVFVMTSIHAADSTQALDRVASFFPPALHRHILTRLSLTLKGVVLQDLVPRKDGHGSVVATEVLVINDALRRVIRDGDWKHVGTLIQTGKKIGMQSMQESLEGYYKSGIIEAEYLKEYRAI